MLLILILEKRFNSLIQASREYTSTIISSIVGEILKIFFSRIKKSIFLQDDKLVSLSKIVFYFNNTKMKGLLKLGLRTYLFLTI
jgi:hypothetical protein